MRERERERERDRDGGAIEMYGEGEMCVREMCGWRERERERD